MLQLFRNLTTAVKHLLIINVLVFLAAFVLRQTMNIDLTDWLALYYVGSDHFRIWQLVTYMFLHVQLWHLFLNMYALWMFGCIMERFLGLRRFLIYYFVCGIGAGLLQILFMWLTSAPVLAEINAYAAAPTPDALIAIVNDHFNGIINPDWVSEVTNQWRANPGIYDFGYETSNALINAYDQYIIGIPSLGVSGATYGLLLAFAMLFPEEKLFIIPFPFPIKAKWLVLGSAAIELSVGIIGTLNGIGRIGIIHNVGHFAHIGGMLFGLILILIWRKRRNEGHWRY